MELRSLGQSGISVSCLGLGTWAMGGDPQTWGLVDDRESIATLQQALDLGVNLIDTAPIYGRGHSEEIVGKAIQGRRTDVVLATKCGLLFPSEENTLPPRSLSRDSILRECEQSLRRLRVEVIDLYSCHWPDPVTPVRETMEALTFLQKQGKIRAIGLSNFSVDHITAAREFGPIHAVQCSFSLVNPRAADDLIPWCAEHGISVLAYSPLGKGLLTGKFTKNSRFDGVRGRDVDFSGRRLARHLDLVESLRPLAERNGKSVAQIALQWVVNTNGVTAALVGAKRPSQLQENMGGAGWSLSEADQEFIEARLKAAS